MGDLILMFAKQRAVDLLPNYLILSLLVLFAVGPIVVLGFNSLKTQTQIAANPLGPPTELHFENFTNAWEVGKFSQTVTNSVILVICTVLSVLLFGGMAAYSLSRLDPPGESLFMVYMLVGSTLPFWLFLVPLFSLWRVLGLTNSLFGLILLYTAFNAPFSIFLLRSFMIGVPRDFDEAARVDGANTWQIFTKILLPLTWPGFLTVGLVVGLGVWSEFQVALIFVTKPELFPVTTSYYNFTSRFSRDWALTSAAAVIMIAPILVLFLALQRRFIDGLTQGGLKA